MTAHSYQYKKIEFFIIGFIFVVVIVVIYFLYNFFPFLIPLPVTGVPKNITMVTYRDPDHYFTMKIPAKWIIVNDENDQNFTSDNIHYTDYKAEEIAIMSKNVDTYEPNDATIFFIEVWKKAACFWNFPNNTTVDGLPANFDGSSQYIINTTNAGIFLSEHAPGLSEKNPADMEMNPGGPLNPPTPPGPPPLPIYEENLAILHSMISSFKPIDNTPAQCPPSSSKD